MRLLRGVLSVVCSSWLVSLLDVVALVAGEIARVRQMVEGYLLVVLDLRERFLD